MSVLLRRSLCLSCPRSTLARSFSSTPLFLRPEAITNGATKLKKTRKSKEKDPELTGPPTRNLLEESKLQEFLDNLASKQDISLKDFEREYKPFRRPGKGEPNYENEYNKVVERLLRSFSLVQLRNLVQLYDIDTPGKISKRRAAAMIIEDKWRWPSPTSIRQENSDAETIYETFPLDAKHAFLILGKDGTHLLDLSAKFGVHVSFSSKPFSLKAEGSRASLRTLGEYIDEFKKGIREEYFQPTLLENVDADSLQRISRVSGVFAENAGNGLVRLTYKDCDERAASFAQRLILRTATEVKESIPALIYSAPIQTTSTLDQPHPTYSLYPFLPSQPKAQISRQQNLFRVRRVGDWLRSGMNNMNEGNPTSSLADVACATDFSGNSVDFRHALLAQDNGLDVDENEPSTRLTASFGHFLVSCESSNQSSIKPPLSGSQELSKVLEWFRSNESKSVFAPSLPHSLINCAPTKQRLVHRVVYRSSSATETCVENLLKFELVLDALNSNPFAPAKLEANDSSEQPNNPFKMVPTCSAESSRHLDLLLPDRPMDIRLSLSTNHVVADEDWPDGLRSYFDELRSFLSTPDQANGQPDAPLTLTRHGLDYHLSSSSTVRQTLDPVPTIPTVADSSLHTTAESILELENKERSRVCQVTCDDITSDASWSSFLKYCDALASPQRSKPRALSWEL